MGGEKEKLFDSMKSKIGVVVVIKSLFGLEKKFVQRHLNENNE